MEGIQFAVLFVWLYALAICTVLGSTFDPYMDNLMFDIKWPGGAQPQQTEISSEPKEDDNSVVIMTQNKEKYKCVLPTIKSDKETYEDDAYQGPSAAELLKPLLTQSTCSYRIESYWTYEMCHGRFLRQYHEEKEPGKKPKLQEYFLGYYKDEENKVPTGGSSSTASTDEETTAEEQPDAKVEAQIPAPPSEEGIAAKKPPTHKVEGFDLPYFEVVISGGTKCDLTGGHRRASLRYVCVTAGKGEVYELKESSTCEYEVVILTDVLCSHPDYQPLMDPVNQIQCHPIGGSPARPKSLESLESESLQARYNKKETFYDEGDDEDDDDDEEEDDDDNDDELIIGIPPKEKSPAKEPVHFERKSSKPSSMLPAAEKSLVRDFLNGEYCLQGGHGWWKHEFCYGKRVIQYHESRATGRVEVLLGVWDQAAHLEWIQKHPSKKPKPAEIRGTVNHFYTSGDICDLTGKPRFVEVKLKCKHDPEQPNAVIIYLTEPKSCEYSLVVESPILCTLITQADDNGLITV